MLKDTIIPLKRTQKNQVPYQEPCEFEELWILGVLDFKRANKWFRTREGLSQTYYKRLIDKCMKEE